MLSRSYRRLLFGLVVWRIAAIGVAADLTPEQVEFFESRIRPVLAQDCYECHRSGDKLRGGLALDSRSGVLAGGDSGAVIVPGDPAASLLMKMIRHEIDDESLKMPKAGAQLEAEVLADFEKWIAMGAPDPRDAPASEQQVAADTDWQAVLERRKSWWSFQPVRNVEPPTVADDEWSATAVDLFVKARLDAEAVTPVAPATAEVLVRRLYFVVIGLPPTVAEVEKFVAEHAANANSATEDLVDQLLNDPRFGERWARHWMDWMRYAETHGSEGDPAIPYAWRYRDYLIRALNADVPYDQLLREHVAGDLLAEPRVNDELGLNESIIGAAPWRFVQHGFAPTDALDEQVRFTDDQIDTFSKAFLGLTISCARCHDHKFDAISQTDFYSLFGILKTCRPALVAADAPGVLEKNREQLAALKPQIRKALGEAWSADGESLAPRLLQRESGAAPANKGSLRKFLQTLQGDAKEFSPAWEKQIGQWRAEQETLETYRSAAVVRRWDFSKAETFAEWYGDGEGISEGASPAGEFSIAVTGDEVVLGIYPAGVFSHGQSDRHRAVLQSPNVDLSGENELWLRVAGDGESLARYVVRNYPRSGTVYPVQNLKGGDWRWQNWSLKYWDGDRIFVELSTAADSAVLAKSQNDRSWFGVREVLVRKKVDGEALPNPPEVREFLQPLFAEVGERVPANVQQLAEIFARKIREISARWGRGEVISDAEALLLDRCLREGFLSNKSGGKISEVASLLTSYRRLEADVPTATRVPGMLESKGEDQALFVRGDHHSPGAAVPRRFLEAIDSTPYDTEQSGRLELAADMTRTDNPFASRVIVNRIWHHVFGAGLVRTPDNFGRLGEQPSHPDLLDHLAGKFTDEGWSMKSLIRELLLTRTWQLDSTPSSEAGERDPENRLLSHQNLHRLEAEAIRDSLLAVSGELDSTSFGVPVDGNSRRRSIYVQQRRNNLDEFLAAFDAPVPTSTKGRRDVTNVPAQSLAMLNGSFARLRAAAWGKTATASTAAPKELVERLFRETLARKPSAEEVTGALALVGQIERENALREQQRDKLTRELQHQRKAMLAITAPVRERLIAEWRQKNPEVSSGGQKPIDAATAFGAIAQWTFDDNARDSVGGLHGELRGTARIEDGALVVDGEGFLTTEPLLSDLKEKTLEVRVQLQDLEQRAGGVMGVQDLQGGLFDSIVWAEMSERRWLAGSNNHKRTVAFAGADEKRASTESVHLVITYSADGTIRGYRNGQPYGEPIRKAPLQRFEAGAAQVVFGLRHGTAANGNRALKGRIFEARLYDRALDEAEVAALAAGEAASLPRVTDKQVLAALSEEQRQRLDELATGVSRLEQALADIEKLSGPASESPWAGLAHAVFNLKEFVYLR